MTSTNLIKSLGAADIDTAELVKNLVNATKEPRQKLIDLDKKKAEVALSSAALLKSALSTFQSVATELGSADKLNKLNLSSTDPSVVTAFKGSAGVAKAGSYGVEVLQLAKTQRTVSVAMATDFTLPTEVKLTLSRDEDPLGADITIPQGSTPAQIATAINASPAARDGGIVATVINTGKSTPMRVVLQGRSGFENRFSVSHTGVDLGFSTLANTVSPALNSRVKINGIEIERNSNTINDAISGLSLSLNSISSGRETNIGVSTDTTGLLDGARTLVESYNLLTEFLVKATGPAIEGDEIAGSLRSDSNARGIRNKLRETFTAQSRSASGSVTHWMSLGLTLDREGTLKLDEGKFIKAFEDSPQDAIKALSNNASSPYIFSDMPSGLAGDLAVVSYGMIRTTGVVPAMTKGFEANLARTTKKQAALDEYINRLTSQYEKQFSALNGVLASFKNTQAQLERSLNFNSDK
jgi:flagellar hook-associated protein 2